MSQTENLLRIKVVYNALEELKDKVVFVGGATVSLYTDRIAEEVRPTDDIDILLELADYGSYTAIEDKLRAKGFENDIGSPVICRYKVQGIIVDVMPTTEILGFSNKWYPQGFTTAIKYNIGDGYMINIFRPEYFIATKIEAFKGRGSNDGRTSSDFEDIVYVLNNRTTIWEELDNAENEVKKYLENEFRKLLENNYLNEWISVHLEYTEQKRMNYIIANMLEFCERTSPD